MLGADDGLACCAVSRGLNCSEFLHTDSGPVKLTVTVGAYAWHRRHHLVHIGQLILRRVLGLTDRPSATVSHANRRVDRLDRSLRGVVDRYA